jgi:GTP-binding protein HflX
VVGYTNAGKSTLLNTLTGAEVITEDKLFATLDPRSRRLRFPEEREVVITDTVGFIRDLPPDLFTAFRATFEEVADATLLLIVLDASDPAAELQHRTVMSTLDDLFAETARIEKDAGETWTEPRRVLLLNKADRLKDNASLLEWQGRSPGAIPVSALPGPDGRMIAGQDALEAIVREEARGDVREVRVRLALSEAKAIHVIENRGEVLDREYDTTHVVLHARIGNRQLDQLRAAGARMEVTPVAF